MTPSRFLVMAMPSPTVRDTCEGVLNALGLRARLQGAMFDPANWHQSLTAPFFDRSAIEPLRRACARIHAPACTLVLNRIRGSGPRGSIHWSFHARGTPPCFTRLLAEMKEAQLAEGLQVLHGHRPHITVSYAGPFSLPTQRFRPVQWVIDSILLVEGHAVDGHFVYDVMERCPLQPAQPSRQRDLFDGP